MIIQRFLCVFFDSLCSAILIVWVLGFWQSSETLKPNWVFLRLNSVNTFWFLFIIACIPTIILGNYWASRSSLSLFSTLSTWAYRWGDWNRKKESRWIAFILRFKSDSHLWVNRELKISVCWISMFESHKNSCYRWKWKKDHSGARSLHWCLVSSPVICCKCETVLFF